MNKGMHYVTSQYKGYIVWHIEHMVASWCYRYLLLPGFVYRTKVTVIIHQNKSCQIFECRLQEINSNTTSNSVAVKSKHHV